MGRFLTVVGMVVGMVMTTIPIVVVGKNFAQAWEDRLASDVMYRIQVMMLDQVMRADDH